MQPTAMQPTTLKFLRLAQIGYFGLLIYLPLWHFVLAPSAMSPMVLAVLTLGPLLLPLRGILRKNPYTFAWANFVVMFYMLHGLTLLWDKPDERLWVVIELLLSTTMFIGCTYFAKHRGRELGLSIRKKKKDEDS